MITSRSRLRLTFGGIGLLLLFIILNFIYARIFLADYYSTKGREKLYIGEIGSAGHFISKAVSLNPLEPAYRRNKAATYISATLYEEISEEDINLLKNRALAELSTAYRLQPYNLVNIKSLLPQYYFLALSDVADPEKGFDGEYREEALAFYLKVEGLAPTDASFALDLAEKHQGLDNQEKAEELYRKALDLKPDLIEAREKLNHLISVK